MSEAVARSVLRVIGITTILVGVILVGQAVFGWLAVPNEDVVSGLGVHVSVEGMVGKLARAAIMSNGIVIALGFLLCALSPGLARYVAGSMPSNKILQGDGAAGAAADA